MSNQTVIHPWMELLTNERGWTMGIQQLDGAQKHEERNLARGWNTVIPLWETLEKCMVICNDRKQIKASLWGVQGWGSGCAGLRRNLPQEWESSLMCLASDCGRDFTYVSGY